MTNGSLTIDLVGKFSNCLSCHCQEGRCKLRLDSLRHSSLVIIDGLKYQEFYNYRERLCDCIIFYIEGSIIVSVVELTGGRMDAEKGKKQLIGGAKVAEDAIGTYRANNFLPVALFGRRTHPSELKVMASLKLRFQGKNYNPIIERCGSSLKSIIETYRPF